MNLSEEQIEFAIGCVSVWLREGFPDGDVYAPDAEHSAFLRRLLRGFPALDSPPPLRFSYPDYDLAEGKPVQILEIWERPPHWISKNEAVVIIDQHAQWQWKDKRQGILLYRPTGEEYIYTESTNTLKKR